MKRLWTYRFAVLVLPAFAATVVIWPATGRADGGPAQDLAQKFAAEQKVQEADLLGAALAAAKKAEEAKRKEYEAELLSRARRERERLRQTELIEAAKLEAARRQAEERKRADEAVRAKLAAEVKSARAEVERLTKDLNAARVAAKQEKLRLQRDEELKQLTAKLERAAAARKARKAAAERDRLEEKRRLAEKTAAVKAARAQAELARKEQEKVLAEARAAAKAARAEADRLAAAVRKAELERRNREAKRRASSARRADEAWRAAQIARDKETKRRALLGARRDSGPFARNLGRPDRRYGFEPGAGGGYGVERHVAVLLVMQPGNRGIRRHNKTADPLLCTPGGCYISQGATIPSRLVPRRRALGFFNTHGRRAGACNRRLGCIFRNVHLEASRTYLQPVDMRLIHHDRRQVQVVSTPSRCDVRGGELNCTGGFAARDYVMWLVPESIAANAGPRALEDALARGLVVSSDQRWADLVEPRPASKYGDVTPY